MAALVREHRYEQIACRVGNRYATEPGEVREKKVGKQALWKAVSPAVSLRAVTKAELSKVVSSAVAARLLSSFVVVRVAHRTRRVAGMRVSLAMDFRKSARTSVTLGRDSAGRLFAALVTGELNRRPPGLNKAGLTPLTALADLFTLGRLNLTGKLWRSRRGAPAPEMPAACKGAGTSSCGPAFAQKAPMAAALHRYLQPRCWAVVGTKREPRRIVLDGHPRQTGEVCQRFIVLPKKVLDRPITTHIFLQLYPWNEKCDGVFEAFDVGGLYHVPVKQGGLFEERLTKVFGREMRPIGEIVNR
jgi:hypothetical protein